MQRCGVQVWGVRVTAARRSGWAGVGFAAGFVMAVLSGCASITEGSSQAISVATEPAGATCRLDRAGQQLAVIDATPGTAIIKPKSKDDILVTCEKPGYQQATAVNKSDAAAARFGNLLLGGPIGVLVDVQTGAAYKYDGAMTLTLPSNPPSPALLPTAVPLKDPPRS